MDAKGAMRLKKLEFRQLWFFREVHNITKSHVGLNNILLHIGRLVGNDREMSK
jgi:hypothetical protein